MMVEPESLPPKDTSSKLSRHCLNYMRQMVLCRADLALDPVLGIGLGEARVRPDTNQCVDWRRVYEELEKNQREYAQSEQSEQKHQVRRPFLPPSPPPLRETRLDCMYLAMVTGKI